MGLGAGGQREKQNTFLITYSVSEWQKQCLVHTSLLLGKAKNSTYLQFCTQHYINVRFIRWFGKIFNCVTENQLETGDREFRSTSFSNFKAQTNPPTLPELSGFDVSKLEFQCALLLLLQIAQTLKVTSIFTSPGNMDFLCNSNDLN